MTTVQTIERTAIFINRYGKMRRRFVPTGTVLTDVERRPQPSWSQVTFRGESYLIATPVLDSSTRPVEESRSNSVPQRDPLGMTGDGYRACSLATIRAAMTH